MSDTVKYLIAQYIPDPFRREPRNVGVIAARGDKVIAKFFGETAPGVIDGRRLRPLPNPEIYKQWADYWRSMAAAGKPLEAFAAANAANYQTIVAGEVNQTDDDPLEDVVSYLYSLLVSDGGLQEALGVAPSESEPAAAALHRAVDDELTRLNILARNEGDLSLVKYPVRPSVPLQGTAEEPHVPSFVQENGLLFVMETVDFTTREKERAKDHAGLASYMFEDLRQARGSDRVRAISLVRVRAEDHEHASVRYGMSILKSESFAIVDWEDEHARNQFLGERQRVAMAIQ